MAWGDDEDQHARGEPGRPGPWSEPLAWLGCLVAAVVPTAMVTALVRVFEPAPWSPFAPLLYVALFTLMVLAVRPWTFR